MCSIRELIAVFAVSFVIEVASFAHCHAEEPLFMDGDPRYLLVYAKEMYRHYLDPDSCTIISDNENTLIPITLPTTEDMDAISEKTRKEKSRS